MRALKSLSVALIATMGLASLPGGSWATENAQQRRDARHVKQDTRQGARQTKQECRAGNEKSNAACRQEKRGTKAEGRQTKRATKHGTAEPTKTPHRARSKTTLPSGLPAGSKFVFSRHPNPGR